ncbi:MAG: type IV toxin-antitoxin system AbiEi family antitoxin domain-containing protein [Actinobacteria bacterium]|nr:type IV toxin-antitoxin system AbiEi family antitoxin domain-containing protein [Actinomycetota bacterium]
MPRLTTPDPPLPVLFTAGQVMAAGLSRDQIRHRLRSGRWVRVGRGHYRQSDWAPLHDTGRFGRERIEHAHRAIAAVLRNPGCVIGFESAAILHQLPLVDDVPTQVSLIAPPGAWTGRRSGIVFRQAALGSHEVTGQRIPVTTPARSWLDLARLGTGLPLGWAVALPRQFPARVGPGVRFVGVLRGAPDPVADDAGGVPSGGRAVDRPGRLLVGVGRADRRV